MLVELEKIVSHANLSCRNICYLMYSLVNPTQSLFAIIYDNGR